MTVIGLLKIIAAAGFFISLIIIAYFLHMKVCIKTKRFKLLMVEINSLIFLCFSAVFLMAGAFFYTFYIEPNWIEINKVTIKSPELYTSLKGIKIVQISDLHTREYGFKERRMAGIINSVKPDIVFFTGELIGEGHDIEKRLKIAFEIFDGIDAPLGIWASPDVFDMYMLNIPSIRDRINKSKIRFLVNENTKIITAGENYFWLIGVADAAERQDDLRQAMTGVPINAPKLLLSHSPEIVDKAANFKIGIILSGHTQGGQTGLKWIRKRIKYFRKYERYMAGLYKINDTFLYVNKGIETKEGTGRFLCRPEVTVINITD